jgi:hypothetical protein
MIKVQRQIDALKSRLQSWDPVTEREREEKERQDEQAKQQQQQQHDDATITNKKKKGRKGPETWKLRGAAKPAWQVYDFDTRYVDPHMKAHEHAQQKAARSKNIFQLYKGRFGQERPTITTAANDDSVHDAFPPQPYCRQYLSLLMQLALLCIEANKIKSAVVTLEECVELDGTDQPITNARCRLMRLYLQINQPQLARQFLLQHNHCDDDDRSVWIRYSAALIDYVSWKILQEDGSSRQVAETMLGQAIQANVYCAYYMAFHEHFTSIMEYTDEIEDAPEGTLEEAIEYCCSEQMSLWSDTDGAIPWIRSFLGRVLFGGGGEASTIDEALSLRRSDLDWNAKLLQLEAEQHNDTTTTTTGIAKPGDAEQEEQHDTQMYCGMFRTAMEMLEESGEMKTVLKDAASATNDSVKVKYKRQAPQPED